MAGSTISTYLSMFKTKARQRSPVQDFRIAYGDITDLNERNVELAKGQELTIDANTFLVLTCSEALPMTLTTYQLYQGQLFANETVDVLLQGVLHYPGKISIYITNPVDNTSDLPYRFSAVYS